MSMSCVESEVSLSGKGKRCAKGAHVCRTLGGTGLTGMPEGLWRPLGAPPLLLPCLEEGRVLIPRAREQAGHSE